MDHLLVTEVASDALWLLLKLAAPLCLIALCVGLVVSFFQAITQIQEPTLSFVPKVIAIFLVLLLWMPRMGSMVGAFMYKIFNIIATIP